MQTLRTMLVLALSTSVLVACDDDDGVTAPTDDNDDVELTGTFEASNIEFTDVEDPTSRVDLVQEGGAFAVNLSADNTFDATFEDGTAATVATTGTFDITGDQIRFSDDPFLDDAAVTPRTFVFMRDTAGGLTTLSDAESAWDIDGDGQLDTAELLIQFES